MKIDCLCKITLAFLIIVAGLSSCKKEQISRSTIPEVSQIYPSYNTSPKQPDITGMSSNAVELAAKMKMGWNLGNTMEAPVGKRVGAILSLQKTT